MADWEVQSVMPATNSDWVPVSTMPQPQPSLVNNSFLTGVKEAAEPMATAVQGFGDLIGKGLNAVGIPTRDTSQPLPHNVTVPGEFLTPGTVQDDSYQPQTLAGQYTKAVGQFAPGIMGGPEGAIPKVVSTVVPALASESAGQLTKGTAAEPYARTLAAILSVGASGGITRPGKALAQTLAGTGESAPSAVDAVAPTVQQLKNASQDSYNAVFNDPSKNVIISKDALSGLADHVTQIAADHGFKPQLNPKAAVVINDVRNLPNENSTLAGLEMTRRLASNVASDYGTSDGALASKIKAAITGFMSNLGDADVIGSADTSGVQDLNDARANWAQMRKAAIIQKISDDADIRGAANYTQAGADTALRRGFANLATNKAKMAQFTPEEQDAIRLVAQGTLGANVARSIGKFAARGPMSAYLATSLGHMIGGPMGSAAMLGAGEAARGIANSATQNNVDALSALIRGGPEAQAALAVNKRAALINGLNNYAPALAGATSIYAGNQ